MEQKLKNWVHLNKEGEKELGHIFSNGIVPTINCMIPNSATLQGQEGVQTVWKIDLKYLSEEQFDKCLDYISKKSGVNKEIIRKDLLKDGFIPLRDSLVSGRGTSQIGMFL